MNSVLIFKLNEVIICQKYDNIRNHNSYKLNIIIQKKKKSTLVYVQKYLFKKRSLLK